MTIQTGLLRKSGTLRAQVRSESSRQDVLSGRLFFSEPLADCKVHAVYQETVFQHRFVADGQ
jgi:hypothetical protein